LAGKFSASNIPVTTADRPYVVLVIPNFLLKKYSKTTHEHIDVNKTINAFIPKKHSVANITGKRETITSLIIFCVVCFELMCGAVEILYII
jgi:hypothetical protein